MSTKNVTRNLIIVKVPLKPKTANIKAEFPPLNNLHLELLENKKKLKPGLPLVTIQQPVKKIKEKDTAKDPVKQPVKQPVKEPIEKQVKNRKKKTDDSDLLKALGENKEPKEEPKEEEPKEEEPKEEPEEEKEEEKEEPEEEPEESQEPQKTPEEIEAEKRQEYIWRFKILKKKYPKADIPEYNEHSDVNTMVRKYDDTLKEISMDTSVENYRTYLIFSFLMIEYASTQWFSVDLSGFTKAQLKVLKNYDTLLIELGEKSYSSLASSLPVEIRLVGFILLQAATFYIAKIMFSKAGKELGNLFSAMTGMPEVSNDAPKRRRMRGPTIKPEDIRNMKDDD